jgi:hypothetical protein
MSIKGSRPACLIAMIAVLVVAPAASQQQKIPKTQVWIDVATHSFAGMPDMGFMGGLAMGALGGKRGSNVYGSTRYGGSPGQYLDIAVLNSLKPGVPAEQAIPAGLQMGNSLDLLPYKAPARASAPVGGEPTDFKVRILIYWGCGATVRAGQPSVIEMSSNDGKLKASGAMQGRYVPDRTAKVGPGYITWPNDKNRQNVPSGASLVGGHAITGDGMPESLKFQLEAAQDFMPKIDLRSTGDVDSGITWSWQSVTQARGYFLHAIGQKGDATVFWSSAETRDAGSGVLDYLPPATVDKWIKERVLLGPGVNTCAMPKGIFGAAGEGSNGGMLRMVAFGPETHFVYPPKPAKPSTPWNPEWNVRVRVKSSTIFPIGMDMSGMDEQDGERATKPKPKSRMGLLKGLLGG